MAAVIQARTNAPCKEKKRVPSVTVERNEQLSPIPASPQRSELAQRRGPPDTSNLAPSRSERHRSISPAMARARPKAVSNKYKSRARSDELRDSDEAFSFTDFIHVASEADLPVSRRNASKRPRIDFPQPQSHTQSPQQSSDITSTVGVNLPTDTSTVITIPDMVNNNDKTESNRDDVSESLNQLKADEKKRELRLRLTNLLPDNKVDLTTILREIIPATRKVYMDTPNRKYYYGFEAEFKTFIQALDYWEYLITTHVAYPSTIMPHFKDALQDLAAKKTFEDRVAALYHTGPSMHINFPIERLTIFLALFFEGLLGNSYMPFSFKDLVNRLRTVNSLLYNTADCSEYLN